MIYNVSAHSHQISMKIENRGESEQLSDIEDDEPKYFEPSEKQKELIEFVVSHCDRWRDHRDQNYMEDWEKYERIFRGKWSEEDKHRQSERSRIISPATQQAVETRHAEMMEAIFGQGEFFDIKDDLADKQNIDVNQYKKQLMEDFSRDKVRKSFDQIELMAEIYGTGIGEIIVSKKKEFYPATLPIGGMEVAYGTAQRDRISVQLVPVNPKNFLWDPNGTSVDDCMGVAIEKYVSVQKVAQGIENGKYNNVNIDSFYKDESLEPTQEKTQFQDEKVLLLTYYGLVPRELIADEEVEELVENEELDDYGDMVEAIVIIGNGEFLLKAEENPYMMQDRPVIAYQDDTVPGRLPGRGTVEKGFNMQAAIDSSMRMHFDSMALTQAPMMGIDVTRIPRGMKFEVIPGKSIMTNGNPAEILTPLKFGATDSTAIETAREAERMMLMATNTVDSQGQVTQVARDSGFDMSVATMIKKNKRALVNRQEDFIIPFVQKATWRYMQFDPERYPAVDVNFIPTATLGIIAREYEQKQLAFLIQTLGKDSRLTPILMASVIKNTSMSDREEIAQQMLQSAQPNPEQQQAAMAQMQAQMQLAQAQIADTVAATNLKESQTIKNMVDTQLAPEETRAKVLSAISRNLPDKDAAANAEFDRRYKLAELMLKEEDINVKKEDIRSNERITVAQMMKQ